MFRYTNFPKTLYRLQRGVKPKLRQYSFQTSVGKTTYDFRLNENGLYMPLPTTQQQYIQPNGLALNSLGHHLINLSQKFELSNIFEIHEGTAIPEELILIEQKKNRFSLQTSAPTTAQKFELAVGRFLKQQRLLHPEQFKAICRQFKSAQVA